MKNQLFIDKCKIIHGEKYDYSLVNYINSQIKVIIKCEKHGEFKQTPNVHLNGCGCPNCSKENKFLTKDVFIEKSIKIHDDKYDYSLVEYINNKTPVKIICPVHGVFEQTPKQHLSGQGCKKCHILTTDIFVERSIFIHGDKYDYSLVDYVNSHLKIKIICPTHGVFEQRPYSHLQGQGCPHCDNKNIDTKIFIKRANKIHGNKYDYSLVEYKDNRIKIKIICPLHGVFEQSPCVHLRGFGCSSCSGNKKNNTENFIIKSSIIHDNKYDYSLVEYVNNRSIVKIICPKHGIFEQNAKSHLKGNGCSICSNRVMKSTTLFIEQAKKIYSKYDYSMVDYRGAHKKIKIICPQHGIFEITPNQHLRGTGCNKCINRKGEFKIENILLKEKIEYYKQKTFEGCKNKKLLKFDFYLPHFNTCIEYDGIQHFSPIEYFGGEERLKAGIVNDRIKDDFCDKNKINLIRIKYDDVNYEKTIYNLINYNNKKI